MEAAVILAGSRCLNHQGTAARHAAAAAAAAADAGTASSLPLCICKAMPSDAEQPESELPWYVLDSADEDAHLAASAAPE